MKPMTLALAAACCVGVSLAGCSAADPEGPPQIRLGLDECAACGMIIAEDRFAAAIVVDDERGPHTVLFDDVGCMLDYRDEHGAGPFRRVWVDDYAARSWIDATTATYLRAAPGAITTPMGSGMVAFGTRDACVREHARVGGEIGTLEELARVRRAWREARRAGDADPGETPAR